MRNFRFVLAVAMMLTLGCGVVSAQFGRKIRDAITKKGEDSIEEILTGSGSGTTGRTSSSKGTGGVGISKTATKLDVNEEYDITVALAPKKNDYKIVAKQAGDITISLKGTSEGAMFAFYDSAGGALDPTNRSVSVGTSTSWYYRYDLTDVFGRDSDTHENARIGFEWNKVSHKYVGRSFGYDRVQRSKWLKLQKFSRRRA